MGTVKEKTLQPQDVDPEAPPFFLFFPYLLCSSSPTNRVSCPLGKECMSARFCPSEEVETLDSDMVCGNPGFHRYCCSPQIREFPVETEHQPILSGPGSCRIPEYPGIPGF